jgi:hypothetical protein
LTVRSVSYYFLFDLRYINTMKTNYLISFFSSEQIGSSESLWAAWRHDDFAQNGKRFWNGGSRNGQRHIQRYGFKSGDLQLSCFVTLPDIVTNLWYCYLQHFFNSCNWMSRLILSILPKSVYYSCNLAILKSRY